MIITRPVKFQGAPEEKAANRASHNFLSYGEETECGDCCCKPWHKAAEYPCGASVPRETVSTPVLGPHS